MTYSFIGWFWSPAGVIGFLLAILALVCLLAAKHWGLFHNTPLLVRFGMILLILFFLVGMAMLIKRMIG